CNSSGGTAAVTVASIAGGVLVGSQFATHSKIEVTVEVYAGDRHDAAFVEPRPPALTRQVLRVVDPVLEPSLAAHKKCVESVAPIMDALRDTAARLRSAAENLAGEKKTPE